jgi:hypothetical protein
LDENKTPIEFMRSEFEALNLGVEVSDELLDVLLLHACLLWLCVYADVLCASFF